MAFISFVRKGIFENKRDAWVLFLLAILLAAPRLSFYLYKSGALLFTDSVVRYIPSVDAVINYWPNYFSVTGPLYVAWIHVFKLVFGVNYLFWVVTLQHLLGWLTALIAYVLLSNIRHNGETFKWLWFLAVLFVFSSPSVILYEHSIVRESLSMFFTTIGLSLILRHHMHHDDDSRWMKGLLIATWLLFIGSFVRQEIIFLWILSVAVVIKMCWRYRRLGLVFLMIFPPLILSLLYSSGKTIQDTDKLIQRAPYSGATFNVAYHYLRPSNFNYISNRYPELVKAYYDISSKSGGVGDSMGKLYEATNSYIAQNNLRLDFIAVMDEIFIDQAIHNPREYLLSYFLNLKVLIIGNDELEGVKLSKLVSPSYLKMAMSYYAWPNRSTLNIINAAITVMLVACMIVMKQKPPLLILIAFVLFVLYLSCVAIFANGVARFRLPVELLSYVLAWIGPYLLIKSKRRVGRDRW